MIYTYLSLYGFRTYSNLCKLLVRLEKYLSKYPEAFSLIDTPSKRRIELDRVSTSKNGTGRLTILLYLFRILKRADFMINFVYES